MKKILVIFIISIILISCNNKINHNNINKVQQKNDNSTITGNIIYNESQDNKIKLKEQKRIGQENNDGYNKNIKIAEKADIKNIKKDEEVIGNKNISEKEIKEMRFINLSRDEQIKMVKNKKCDEFTNKSAKKECLHAKADIRFRSFLKLSSNDKLNFDCKYFKKFNTELIKFSRQYQDCLDEKELLKSEQKQINLKTKLKKGDLSYCNEPSIKNKKGFKLDNCKVLVVSSSNKNCSILDKELQEKCKLMKDFFEEKRKKAERNEYIRSLVELEQ